MHVEKELGQKLNSAMEGRNWVSLQQQVKKEISSNFEEYVKQKLNNIEKLEFKHYMLAAVQDPQIIDETNKAFLSTKEITQHYMQKCQHVEKYTLTGSSSNIKKLKWKNLALPSAH